MPDPSSPRALDDVVRLGTGEGRDLHFRALCDTYTPSLRRFFFSRHGRSAAEVEDLTQEVWIRVYRDGRAFLSSLEFSRWLMTIAANVYRNYVRDRTAAKRAAQEVPIDRLEEGAVPAVGVATAPGSPGATEDPLGAVLDHEGRALLARAIGELPDKMRRCALLRYPGGFAYDEIATLLGISIETVKAHLYQARRKLKARLSPYFDTAPEEDPH